MPTSTILIVCDVIATAMIAGFLTMYCLTIGGYFTFMARTGRIGELQGSYPLFRRRTRLKRVYALAMLLQFLIALVALAAGWPPGPSAWSRPPARCRSCSWCTRSRASPVPRRSWSAART